MLLPHQIKYAKGYPDKGMAIHEGGTGKSVCASVWLHDGRDADALVIGNKRIVKKWEAELKKWQTKGTVVTKEQFKKLPIKRWSAVVVDEADEFASPLFTKQRSGLSKALYELVKAYPDMPVLLLTATPVRSNPWNLHTLLCFIGVYIDWKAWRAEFFSLERRPYLRFPAWMPKPDWRERMRPIIEKYGDVVLMRDCVDVLPPEVHRTEKVKPPEPFPGATALTPSGCFAEEHLHEQKGKAKEIIAVGKEYRKIIVVAYYVEQVEALERELSKDRPTFAMHGGTPDQEGVIKRAEEADECFFVVQASLGVGFDGDKFSCVVFASMSYKVRDFVQMKYRVRRIHNLHPVEYVYLIGGRCDKRVYNTIQLGRDFVPSEWSDDNTTRTTEGIESARNEELGSLFEVA